MRSRKPTTGAALDWAWRSPSTLRRPQPIRPLPQSQACTRKAATATRASTRGTSPGNSRHSEPAHTASTISTPAWVPATVSARQSRSGP